MPFRTVSKIGSFTSLSAGSATNTSLPPATERAVSLLERARGDRERDRLVGAAETPDRLDRILLGRVDGELGSELASEVEFLVDDVHRDHAAAGDRRVLDREMSEAADAEHRDQVRRAGAGDLDRLVRGDPGTRQWGSVERIDAVGHLDDVAPVSDGVFTKAAVDRVAHVLLLEAQRLPPGDAVIAGPARITKPRHRDAVANRDLGDAGPDVRDDADPLMTGDKRRRRLHRPVSVRGVDIGVTQSGSLDLDAHLAGLKLRPRHVLDRQRTIELMNDRRPVGAVGKLRRISFRNGGCHRALPVS